VRRSARSDHDWLRTGGLEVIRGRTERFLAGVRACIELLPEVVSSFADDGAAFADAVAVLAVRAVAHEMDAVVDTVETAADLLDGMRAARI